MIPKEKAHVAILEEPEHLNWLRLPHHSTHPSPQQQEHSGDNSGEIQDNNATETNVNESMVDEVKNVGQDDGSKQDIDLGWAQRFDFVVGILHTNYSAYMKQYARMGTSIIGAPALRALSSWVIQAYCHVVIRLSDVLPSYDPIKERTCNVHGVRGDFLSSNKSFKTKGVYFIGKLLWAKGFSQLLTIQDSYRQTHGKYFPIGIIGSGPDESSIQRAFHGRLPQQHKTPISSKNTDDEDDTKDEDSHIMSHPESLRSQLFSLFQKRSQERTNVSPYYYQDAQQYLNIGFEVTSDDINYVLEENKSTQQSSLLQDVSHHSIQTTIKTTNAVKTLASTAMSMVFRTESVPEDASTKTKSSDSYNNDTDDCASETKTTKSKLVLDLPKSRFELRRHAIPAKFLGVKDHASLKDEYTIFLNPSVSEVLCTTTAEALAMGKFVILPHHSSNEFFFQFPNCYSYSSTEECLKHLDHCQNNDPVPLSEKYQHVLSWEAATERLLKSCLMTYGQLQNHHRDKDDNTLAWLHTHSTENVAKLLRKKSTQPNNVLNLQAATKTKTSTVSSAELKI